MSIYSVISSSSCLSVKSITTMTAVIVGGIDACREGCLVQFLSGTVKDSVGKEWSYLWV